MAQGIAGAWIVGMTSLFVILIVYASMSEPFIQLYDALYNTTNDTATHATMAVTRMAWNKWAIILTLAVVIYIIAYSLRREPDDISVG